MPKYLLCHYAKLDCVWKIICKLTSLCFCQICFLLLLKKMNRRSKQTSCSFQTWAKAAAQHPFSEPKVDPARATLLSLSPVLLLTPPPPPPTDLPTPWPLSWRAAWPQWTGSPSWAWGQPSRRRTRDTTSATITDTSTTMVTITGKGLAKKSFIWTQGRRWTRRKLHSTEMANRPTATPVSSPSPSMARRANGWPSVRSISGSVTTSPTTERRAAAGR